ncbi:MULTISPECIES: hypothetical protein [Methylobacteriaceae]|uniref:hypothetical protein n=1 Tax=Methylobacteriaceae TaxID=119045 RepID=UPI0011690FE9|nr:MULTISPECIES: hypothetical protein [Methylobacteriaceae]GEL42926.1 hypothetical protein MEX01_35170 [Methylorubrum extorquens]
MTESDAFVAEMLDALREDDEPMPTPSTASADAAAYRRAEATRKRDERARLKKAGVPPAHAVDSAIASAVAAVLARDGAVEALRTAGKNAVHNVDLISVMRHASKALVGRGFAKEPVTHSVRVRLFG